MKKIVILVILFFISLYGFIKFTGTSDVDYVKEQININIPKPINIIYEDTHEGFHGDGKIFAKLEFASEDKENILEEFKDNVSWYKTPLSENINMFIYGGIKNGVYYGCDVAKDFKIPQVENGYWYFVDHHSESDDSSSDAKIFYRGSFNMTIAIYDIDKNVLYYVEFDT